MSNSPPTIDQRLEKLETLIASQVLNQKKVLTFEEACIYIGRKPSNLYKITSAGQIPHYKPEGKMIYFDRQELDNWMLRNPVKTAAQTGTQAANYITMGKTKSRQIQ